MKKKVSKLLSLLLSLIMVFSLLPAVALAENTNKNADEIVGSVTHGYVSNLEFYHQKAGDANYIDFDFSPDTSSYQLATGDTQMMANLKIIKSDSAPQGLQRRIIYYDDSGIKKVVTPAVISSAATNLMPYVGTLAVGKTRTLYLYVGIPDGEGNFTADNSDIYCLEFSRQASLSNLDVGDGEGNPLTIKPAFSLNNSTYTVIGNGIETISINGKLKTTKDVELWINGEKAESSTASAVAVSECKINKDGLPEVPIEVKYVGDGTARNSSYTLVLDDTDYTPVIIQQPQDVTCGKGETVTLTVAAEEPEKGTISYQWYACGSPISGATSNIYIPATDYASTNTYVCYVSNTVNGTKFVQKSQTTTVKVTATYASPAKITKQPQGAEYYHGAASKQLMVEATAVDQGATLQLQWYVNTKDSTENGTSVEGSTIKNSDVIYTATFVPPTDTIGTLYYYCVVSSTVNGFTANTVSNTAAITAKSLSDIVQLKGSGSKDSPYLIKNVEDLEELRSYVADGLTFHGQYLTMTDDITLPAEWKPIGQLVEGREDIDTSEDMYAATGKGIYILPFSGIFNGGGHTITIAEDGLPLFGYVREATVKNLNIYGEKIAGYGLVNNYVVDYGTDGNYNTGVPATITIDHVTLKSGSKTLNAGFIGGYASGANTVIIQNCTVEKDVVIGYDPDNVPEAIGSLAGSFNGSVRNCISYATVNGNINVGGLVGVKGQAMGSCEILNSTFLGTIHATGNRVGGIIGSGYDGSGSAPSTPVVTIMNCYVAADITGADEVGGILGSEPGCQDCWGNGKGYVENNLFYGMIHATGKNVGGIVGFFKSFNENQGIQNCYYLNTCGTDTGIGAIEILKVDGFDASKFCISTSDEAFADRSIVDLLNSTDSSYKNWTQGEKYPVFSNKAVAYVLTVSGEYKDEYYIGDNLDLTGIILTVLWSDGTTSNLELSAATISGFDSNTRGVQKLEISYGAVKTEITVTVLKRPNPDTNEITVYFTLYGDKVHNSDKDGKVHTLADGNLTEWIAKKSYTVDQNATVKDVFEKALKEAGLEWRNPSGNYVEAIYKKGIELAEFTNGQNSGWMYTLNGTHPLLGVSEQFLNDGDRIIFHYTDDYTKEKGSEKWKSDSGTNVTPSTDLTPNITASNGVAAITMNTSDLKNAIIEAGESSSSSIVIAPKISGTVKKVMVEVPKVSLSTIATETSAALVVETPVGSVTIPNASLAAVASQAAGSTVTVIVESVERTSMTDTQQKAVGDNTVFDIAILSGSKKITSFDSKSITVSLPYTLKDGESADGVTVWYLNDAGELQKMNCTYNKTTGMATFTTTHLSYYVVGYGAPSTDLFKDVKSTDWFYDAVKYAIQNKLFNGTSVTTFSPNTEMTRAMLVTVLYRLEGNPAVTGGNGFKDVVSNEWYTDAVVWANANDIVTGYGNGLFGTGDSVTREQLSAILYRYAQYKSYDITKTVTLSKYTDAASVSTWADSAMKWSVANKLITGTTDTTLSSNGTATRAQVATILMRFTINIVPNVCDRQGANTLVNESGI